MSHLTEEQLVDAYYSGEPADSHLAECPECKASFEQLRELLDRLSDLPTPERGPGYGGEVWTRLLLRLPRTKSRKAWWWILAPALAAMLAIAFLAGRWTERSEPIAGNSEQARERVLLLSISEHLERSQIVLEQVANTDDLVEERDRARELIGANRLLRQTAERLGDAKDAVVLEQLEQVLLDVANAPDKPTKDDAARVQKTIAQNELLFKVRITLTDARERGLTL
jgi:hypothetical protein